MRCKSFHQITDYISFLLTHGIFDQQSENCIWFLDFWIRNSFLEQPMTLQVTKPFWILESELIVEIDIYWTFFYAIQSFQILFLWWTLPYISYYKCVRLHWLSLSAGRVHISVKIWRVLDKWNVQNGKIVLSQGNFFFG